MKMSKSLYELLALTRSSIHMLSNIDELYLTFDVNDYMFYVNINTYENNKIYLSIINDDENEHLIVDYDSIYIDSNILLSTEDNCVTFSKDITEEKYFQLSTLYPMFSMYDINYINFYYNLMIDEYNKILKEKGS